MTYKLADQLRLSFIKINKICKSIELVTLSILHLYKDKLDLINYLIKLIHFSIYLPLELCNLVNLKYLLIPYLTDKSCSGILNTLLWHQSKNVFDFFNYKNIITHIYGTSLKFKKNVNIFSLNKYCIGNIYLLSEESVNYYISYILFQSIVYLNYSVFFFIFNEFFHIYNQNASYYIFLSISLFLNFIIYDHFFLFTDKKTFKNLYFYINTICLLDLLENNFYSELGSRATSMRNSISNSKDNINYYTLLYNRFRQSKITNEIIEIISSSNNI